MKRFLARAATALVLTPVLVAGATPAHAGSVTVPGCFGAGPAIVCNVTVTYGVPAGVEPYDTTIPVCVGSCTDVPVTLIRPTNGEPLLLCVSWTDRTGAPDGSFCVDEDDVAALTDYAGDTAADVLDSVCSGALMCPVLLADLLRDVADRLREL